MQVGAADPGQADLHHARRCRPCRTGSGTSATVTSPGEEYTTARIDGHLPDPSPIRSARRRGGSQGLQLGGFQAAARRSPAVRAARAGRAGRPGVPQAVLTGGRDGAGQHLVAGRPAIAIAILAADCPGRSTHCRSSAGRPPRRRNPWSGRRCPAAWRDPSRSRSGRPPIVAWLSGITISGPWLPSAYARTSCGRQIPVSATSEQNRAESSTPAMPSTRSAREAGAHARPGAGHLLQRVGHHDHHRVGRQFGDPVGDGADDRRVAAVRSVRVMPGCGPGRRS